MSGQRRLVVAAHTRIATPPRISQEPVITITSHPDRCRVPATIRSAPKLSMDRAAMISQNTGAAMTTSITDPMHLMTIDLAAWCGAAGRGNGRASSQWREVTCPACLAKGTEWLRGLVWDMLQTMPPSHEALAFALRAGRLGVVDEEGRPLVMACIPDSLSGDD